MFLTNTDYGNRDMWIAQNKEGISPINTEKYHTFGAEDHAIFFTNNSLDIYKWANEINIHEEFSLHCKPMVHGYS